MQTKNTFFFPNLSDHDDNYIAKLATEEFTKVHIEFCKMCRWIAYAGPEIYLEDILFQQSNSIISQSLAAKESVFTTNGDGFGVAWYNERTKAGLFKDVLPAWNDANLKSLAAHIKTKLFFAHLRATTGTQVSRSNCHPFIWQNWTFMHNGQIGDWPKCRKTFEIGRAHV